MASTLANLRSPGAVQAALNEFNKLGRTAFLNLYGFGKSTDYMVRDPRTGELADSKAIAGVAVKYEPLSDGALTANDFSGGENTVVSKLESLGFEVERIGGNWTEEEVQSTVTSYFQMLKHEANQEPYVKSHFNFDLRQKLKGRTKSAVELKHQNISAVLHALDLPFISGYKPQSNAQLLLRQEVQHYIKSHPKEIEKIIDALEDAKDPEQKTYKGVLVDPPNAKSIEPKNSSKKKARRAIKIDYAELDEHNRKLGRAGEQWVLGYEAHRLIDEGCPELASRVSWHSDLRGDGLGYDILSHNANGEERFIEVKTTNGSLTSPFFISQNELNLSQDKETAFYLYRVFQFRQSPKIYILQGDLQKHLHLEPTGYRTAFGHFSDNK